MQIANITLWLTSLHSVGKKNITPAEYLILKKMHSVHDGRIENVQVTGDIKRSSGEELERLLSKYHPDHINGEKGAFPGSAPSLPLNFSDLPDAPETTTYVEPTPTPPITKHAASAEWDAATPPTED